MRWWAVTTNRDSMGQMCDPRPSRQPGTGLSWLPVKAFYERSLLTWLGYFRTRAVEPRSIHGSSFAAHCRSQGFYRRRCVDPLRRRVWWPFRVRPDRIPSLKARAPLSVQYHHDTTQPLGAEDKNHHNGSCPIVVPDIMTKWSHIPPNVCTATRRTRSKPGSKPKPGNANTNCGPNRKCNDDG